MACPEPCLGELAAATLGWNAAHISGMRPRSPIATCSCHAKLARVAIPTYLVGEKLEHRKRRLGRRLQSVLLVIIESDNELQPRRWSQGLQSIDLPHPSDLPSLAEWQLWSRCDGFHALALSRERSDSEPKPPRPETPSQKDRRIVEGCGDNTLRRGKRESSPSPFQGVTLGIPRVNRYLSLPPYQPTTSPRSLASTASTAATGYFTRENDTPKKKSPRKTPALAGPPCPCPMSVQMFAVSKNAPSPEIQACQPAHVLRPRQASSASSCSYHDAPQPLRAAQDASASNRAPPDAALPLALLVCHEGLLAGVRSLQPPVDA